MESFAGELHFENFAEDFVSGMSSRVSTLKFRWFYFDLMGRILFHKTWLNILAYFKDCNIVHWCYSILGWRCPCSNPRSGRWPWHWSCCRSGRPVSFGRADAWPCGTCSRCWCTSNTDDAARGTHAPTRATWNEDASYANGNEGTPTTWNDARSVMLIIISEMIWYLPVLGVVGTVGRFFCGTDSEWTEHN